MKEQPARFSFISEAVERFCFGHRFLTCHMKNPTPIYMLAVTFAVVLGLPPGKLIDASHMKNLHCFIRNLTQNGALKKYLNIVCCI